MTTLTITPTNDDQETAIRIFLDALHVDYKASDPADDTAYLMSDPANLQHIDNSIKQAKEGKLTKVSLDDIWKP